MHPLFNQITLRRNSKLSPEKAVQKIRGNMKPRSHIVKTDFIGNAAF